MAKSCPGRFLRACALPALRIEKDTRDPLRLVFRPSRPQWLNSRVSAEQRIAFEAQASEVQILSPPNFARTPDNAVPMP